MKHRPDITALLVILFIAAQLAGLGLIAQSMHVSQEEDGTVHVVYEDTAIGARPTTTGLHSFLYLLTGITIGTIILLIIIKFRQLMVWKIWYFVAVTITCFISIGVLLENMLAAIIAVLLATWKIWRPGPIIHNVTEVLVYTGIAVLVVPLLDVLWAAILLLVIAVYDMIAVWKSKHMVKMATFQTESRLFAGLFIPYNGKMPRGKPVKPAPGTTQERSAILGGGDIAFPLLFAGTVLHWLVLQGISQAAAYGFATIVVGTTAVALTGLFILAKRDRFYPAMPPLVFGAYAGFLIIAFLV